jgi:hypothetical protein
MAVLCGSQKLTALDPSAPPRPIEHATITGTVVCDGCTRETGRPNEVSIGDQVVPLVHGKFHVELDGRGIIPVSAALPDMSVVSEGIRWDYRACDTVLELVGKRVYRLTCTMRLRENHF